MDAGAVEVGAVDAGRRRHVLVAALLLGMSLVAVLLGVAVTEWFLFAVPFGVLGAYGAWLGLSDDEFFDAVGAASGDDLGRGPAGLSL
jgi:hypothetical protein